MALRPKYQVYADSLALRYKRSGYSRYRIKEKRHETFLGTGIARTGLASSRFPFLIFKIGESKTNRDEWNFYKAASKRQKKILAKPFYISKDGSILVMERVRRGVVPHKDIIKMRKIMPKNRTWDFDGGTNGTSNTWSSYKECAHNVGLSGLQPKIFDYATERATPGCNW